MADLCWLLSRSYAIPSALKLVGDRYQLAARQRIAVARSACSDQALARRNAHQLQAADLRRQTLRLDGYNVLTSIEAALAGGVVLVGRDGCYRDMASMHGSYRKVRETDAAIRQIGRYLAALQVAPIHWLLDAPVSNSGRLKTMLEAASTAHDWNWHAELVPDPDPILAAHSDCVASSDSQILDHASQWFNLVRGIVDEQIEKVRLVDLR